MKKILIVLIIGMAVLACQTETKDTFEGEYKTETPNVENVYYQTLLITAKKDGLYEITFTATKIQGEDGCTFKGEGKLVNGAIEVSIDDWKEPTVMIIKENGNAMLHVSTQKEENRYALNYFCKGGGTLAGDYKKVTK